MQLNKHVHIALDLADDAVGLVDRLLSKMTIGDVADINTNILFESVLVENFILTKEELSTLQDQLFGRFIEMLQVLTPAAFANEPVSIKLILAGHFYVHLQSLKLREYING